MRRDRDAHLLVADDERRRCDALLNQAVGEGRLTLAEYESRVGEVWAARTRGELDAVVHDLPVPWPSAAPVPARNKPSRGMQLAVAVAAAVVIAGIGAVYIGPPREEVSVAASAPGAELRPLEAGVGDRVIFVPREPRFSLPRGVGDLTVVVPDGYRATLDVQVVGDVTCALACSRSASNVVTLISRERVGHITVLTRAEHQAGG